MATTPEGKVKAAVKRLLNQYGVWYYMPVAGPYARHGIPDFCCIAPGNAAFFIETKAPGKINNTTANQEAIHEQIRAVDGTVFVVDNPQPVKEFLDGILGKKCS